MIGVPNYECRYAQDCYETMKAKPDNYIIFTYFILY